MHDFRHWPYHLRTAHDVTISVIGSQWNAFVYEPHLPKLPFCAPCLASISDVLRILLFGWNICGALNNITWNNWKLYRIGGPKMHNISMAMSEEQSILTLVWCNKTGVISMQNLVGKHIAIFLRSCLICYNIIQQRTTWPVKQNKYQWNGAAIGTGI